VAGTVLRVLQASEGSVAPGTALIELGDLSRLEVVAEPLTTDALRTPPGTPVRIERWGGTGDLQGQVERVEPGAYTKVSALGVEEQRVKVVVTLTSPREQWRALGDGYRVGVRFVVNRAERALQVPTSAVFPWPEGVPRPAAPGASSAPSAAASAGSAPGLAPAREAELRAMAVYAVENGHARLVPVWLRARNGSHAWIERGLDAGARVIVYPPPAVRDGARVVERRP
jgi:HlyD family secretion protein